MENTWMRPSPNDTNIQCKKYTPLDYKKSVPA